VFTKAIVRPPSSNFADGLTSVDLGQPNYERALEQHEAYCLALEDCGLELTRLAADDRYPDSTFVEDTAVLTESGVIFARPGALSRSGEVGEIELVVRRHFDRICCIREPGTLDGGDVCEAAEGGGNYFIGVSRRTNQAGAEQLAAFLAEFGYRSTLIDIRGLSNILHLKSGLAYLGGNRLLVIDELRDLKEFSGYDLVEIDRNEAYGANCLLTNDRVLIASGFPVLQLQLERLDYEIVVLDMSEFQKMDGGLSCLSLRF
jgi:dimethylargininase